MGYTHYFSLNGKVDDRAWSDFISKVWKIHNFNLGAWKIPIDSVIDDAIRLNGVGPSAHETFVLKNANHHAYCMTAQKPYDRIVVMILALAHSCLKGFSWSSDGGGAAKAEAIKDLESIGGLINVKTIKLSVGMTITLYPIGDKFNGTITSDNRDLNDEEPIAASCYDAIESLVLAHACAGVDVASAAYNEGLEVALEAIHNNE